MTRTRTRASKKQNKNKNKTKKTNQGIKIKFFTGYNPRLPRMNTLIKHFPLLHSDDNLKSFSPTKSFNVVYGINKIPKELLTPTLFLTPRRKKYSWVASCDMCDICKIYMILSSRCTFFVLLRNATLEGILHVILLMSFT